MSRRFAATLLAAACLAGCSHAGSITRLSADYNKAMADVRNEQLLLNILRAAAREPLQFSAMGEIAATVDRSAGIDTTIENLIAGGANAISHTVSVSGSNEPVIKITPLSNKEFISGMLTPTSPETLQRFMDLGWDREFMLPLVMAEYRCPGGKIWKNSGETGDGDLIRQRLVDTAAGVTFEEQEEADTSLPIVLNVADDKALEMMRSGIATGYKVVSVTRIGKSGMSAVRLGRPAKSKWVVNAAKLCAAEGLTGTNTLALVDDGAKAPGEDATGYIRFRSVEGIIYFLGERLRRCYRTNQPAQNCALRYVKENDDKQKEQRVLFQVNSGEKPYPVLVGTRFYDRDYWVSRLDSGDVDRTAKTLSFLNQLIALQTDASKIATTPTVLTIGAR